MSDWAQTPPLPRVRGRGPAARPNTDQEMAAARAVVDAQASRLELDAEGRAELYAMLGL